MEHCKVALGVRIEVVKVSDAVDTFFFVIGVVAHTTSTDSVRSRMWESNTTDGAAIDIISHGDISVSLLLFHWSTSSNDI